MEDFCEQEDRENDSLSYLFLFTFFILYANHQIDQNFVRRYIRYGTPTGKRELLHTHWLTRAMQQRLQLSYACIREIGIESVCAYLLPRTHPFSVERARGESGEGTIDGVVRKNYMCEKRP